MLLIHAAGMVNVGINFANVIEVTSKWFSRNINRMGVRITGEERPTTERVRESPGEEAQNEPSFLTSLEIR